MGRWVVGRRPSEQAASPEVTAAAAMPSWRRPLAPTTPAPLTDHAPGSKRGHLGGGVRPVQLTRTEEVGEGVGEDGVQAGPLAKLSPPPSPCPCWPCWKASWAAPARSPASPQAVGPYQADPFEQAGQVLHATTARRPDRTANPDTELPRRSAPSGAPCPPDPARPTPPRWQRGCSDLCGRTGLDGPTLAEAAGCGRSSAASLPATPTTHDGGGRPVSCASRQVHDAALGYASRGIPALPLHDPLPHHSGLQAVTGDSQPVAGRAARVGIRAAANPACTPSAPSPPTRSRTPPVTGPGSWAWWARYPQANIGLATDHCFDVLDVDDPEGAHAIQQLGWVRPGALPSRVEASITGRAIVAGRTAGSARRRMASVGGPGVAQMVPAARRLR